MKKLSEHLRLFGIFMRSVPPLLVALFILSVFCMNLLANKSIALPVDWLALDCGIIVSWFAFLALDVITKHFGASAATALSVLTITVNLVMCLIFFLVSIIPGVWGESFVAGSEGVINGALDGTFGGSWYVLLGSTVAFLASAVINNLINFGIGRAIKRDGAGAYILRSYVSTAVAQLADNLIFAFIVSYNFFGWTALQCFTCAVTGMLVELVSEAAFSPLGYKITKRWKDRGVGDEYFRALKASVGEGE